MRIFVHKENACTENAMRFRPTFGGVVLSIALASPAMASKTVACTIEDRNVQFDLLGNVGARADARVSALHVGLKLKTDDDRLKDDRLKGMSEFPPDFLAQSWLVGPDLHLWLHQDATYDESPGRDAAPEVDLLLIAHRTNESEYPGNYRLSVKAKGQERKLSGRVKCVIDY
jgi:hypothetical protein